MQKKIPSFPSHTHCYVQCVRVLKCIPAHNCVYDCANSMHVCQWKHVGWCLIWMCR